MQGRPAGAPLLIVLKLNKRRCFRRSRLFGRHQHRVDLMDHAVRDRRILPPYMRRVRGVGARYSEGNGACQWKAARGGAYLVMK